MLATRSTHCCSAFFLFQSSIIIITTGQYMNYQTFRNLQFRPMLENTFHSIYIDLRNTSGEKIPFVYDGVNCLVLLFRKASNILFSRKRRYKMVASREVEIPFDRDIGQQRGWGFGALAQVFARTAIPFLPKHIVPPAKRIGADLLDFAAPEVEEFSVVEKNSAQLRKTWEDKL